MSHLRALCQINGCLCIAEFSKCKTGETGKCPTCGQKEFHDHQEWIQCFDCGFAILRSDYEKMMAEATISTEPTLIVTRRFDMDGYTESQKIDKQLNKLIGKFPVKENRSEWMRLVRTLETSIELLNAEIKEEIGESNPDLE